MKKVLKISVEVRDVMLRMLEPTIEAARAMRELGIEMEKVHVFLRRRILYYTLCQIAEELGCPRKERSDGDCTRYR